MGLYCLVVICFVFSEYVELHLQKWLHLQCRGWRETVSSQITSEETDFVASHLTRHEKYFFFGQPEVEMLDGKVVF